VPGGKGHGRTARPLLPVVEELRTLPPEDRACPNCKLPFNPIPGTEDSDSDSEHYENPTNRILPFYSGRTPASP
jgi:hypothetical protein